MLWGRFRRLIIVKQREIGLKLDSSHWLAQYCRPTQPVYDQIMILSCLCLLAIYVYSSHGSKGSMEPPFLSWHVAYNTVTTLRSKLWTVRHQASSKPFFSDTSVAKPTVETVVDMEVNNQIINFLSPYPCGYANVLWKFPIATSAALQTKSGHGHWQNFVTRFVRCTSGTHLLQILHPPLM